MTAKAAVPRGRAGRLDLVATPIGNLADLSERAIGVLSAADVIYCEDTRHTGRLLERANIAAGRLVSLNAHNESQRQRSVLSDLEQGLAVALVSDAGTPLISDPGSRLVSVALAAGHQVSVVPGPSAVLAAVVLSGFDVTRFRFEGFLPRSGNLRRRRLASIAESDCPSVLFEAPNRVRQTLGELAEVAGRDRRVAIARELTKLHEELWHGPIADALDRPDGGRGEHVVVVDAAPAPVAPEHSATRRAIESLIAAGFGKKEAIRAVEIVLGVPHRVAYQAALDVRSGAEQPRSDNQPTRPSGGRPVR